MNSEIKVILFDMGRVLVKIDFDAFPNALGLFTKEQREPFREETIKLDYLFQCGRITKEEFLQKQCDVFHNKFTQQQVLNAYNAIIVEENTEILPLVLKAKERYRIAVLSNTSIEHWQKSHEIAPLLQLFPEKFTSFQIGEMKPARVVYEKVIASLGVEPSSILFIDDVQENIDGAIACGMKGIVYQSVEQVKQELHKLDVI